MTTKTMLKLLDDSEEANEECIRTEYDVELYQRCPVLKFDPATKKFSSPYRDVFAFPLLKNGANKMRYFVSQNREGARLCEFKLGTKSKNKGSRTYHCKQTLWLLPIEMQSVIQLGYVGSSAYQWMVEKRKSMDPGEVVLYEHASNQKRLVLSLSYFTPENSKTQFRTARVYHETRTKLDDQPPEGDYSEYDMEEEEVEHEEESVPAYSDWEHTNYSRALTLNKTYFDAIKFGENEFHATIFTGDEAEIMDEDEIVVGGGATEEVEVVNLAEEEEEEEEVKKKKEGEVDSTTSPCVSVNTVMSTPTKRMSKEKSSSSPPKKIKNVKKGPNKN